MHNLDLTVRGVELSTQITSGFQGCGQFSLLDPRKFMCWTSLSVGAGGGWLL